MPASPGLDSTTRRRLFVKLKTLILALVALLALSIAACGDDDDEAGGDVKAPEGTDLASLQGDIRIDGSSTVFPFAQAAAELFKEAGAQNVNVTVGQSGTGGGFEKFCAGETDISNASRPIDDAEEVPLCQEEGVQYEEVQVANDGIAVVTNQGLEVDCFTVDDLKKIWDEGSKVKNLSEVNPDLPDTELSLYGPGTDSGTFDFFTEQINGEEGQSRSDYSASEDDNVLVQGVTGDEGGLGYFGFSYAEQNQDQLNIAKIDSGDGSCVEPSAETIQNGTYKPLSRPLFMYPSTEAAGKPHVKAFMDFIVQNQATIAEVAQFVPLTDEQAQQSTTKVEGLGGK
jgi:phosphate transport system substrate-binding protein